MLFINIKTSMCKAFYGPGPKLSTLNHVQFSQLGIEVDLERGSKKWGQQELGVGGGGLAKRYFY